MLNYSATATQVVTCARRFLQRFNPGPRDSARAFYSLLGAVAMGLRARSPAHGGERKKDTYTHTLLCEEFCMRRPSPTTHTLSPSLYIYIKKETEKSVRNWTGS